ncbi:hypothetical protein OE88DRAFT_146383 [Heliocybe sulcata]|uniref:Uncharacterized protein n=1 Tax=Heliocybe sulcata TaxID=5364 RepID=A0A5C3NMY6_9AGAM|nr:hypothetical protein OE88DRAFT_146383 [Heliocybe sulcata]
MARPPVQPLRRKGPRINNSPSSMKSTIGSLRRLRSPGLSLRTTSAFCLSQLRLNFGPQDAYAPSGYPYGQLLPSLSLTLIHETPTLPRATLTDNRSMPSLPPTSNRKTPMLPRAILTDKFHLLPSSTSVHKTPTLPRATLTDDRRLCLPLTLTIPFKTCLRSPGLQL